MALAQAIQSSRAAYSLVGRKQPERQEQPRRNRWMPRRALPRLDRILKLPQLEALDIGPDRPRRMISSDQAINVHRPPFDLVALRLTQSGLPGNISPRGLLLGKLAKELIACHGVLLRISRVRESQQGFVGQPCEGLAHERFTASEERARHP